ncbi:hypothetical protein AUC43_12185 [Hymenobacter sedentarius]|uniref:Uncharacterized protein n=1 Tax=Hymenobacter sedentarius TaxID=1411621 RepID=A0A0U3SI30_9BACT|nr:hypothetical protein [Hymenobacter sedentarius]ALW85782.1 hypothetical protein AUC43_12185 [Hymenobacter sedentarius]
MPVSLSYRVLIATFGILLGGIIPRLAAAQTAPWGPPVLREASLRTDTATFLLSRNTVMVQGVPTLYLWYRRDDETVELRLFPANAVSPKPLRLRRNPDYQQLDSLTKEDDGSFRTRLKFQNLTTARFLRLVVEQAADSVGREPHRQVVPLLPLARTSLALRVPDAELFVGEEKVLELTSSNARNVRATGEWVRGNDFDYRVVAEANGLLRLHVLPNQLGARTLLVKLQTERPSLLPNGRLSYQLPVLRQEFNVKGSRLRFLSPDQRSVTMDDLSRRRGVELILDNGRSFELHRTYRIEDQEEAGGSLIAEVFTRQYLSNDRVLCYLRPYNTHRQTEGYLYIKEADVARYITNLDITPQTVIRSAQVLHRGGEWTSSLSVSPGETVDVRLEGEGLQKARMSFEDLPIMRSDSSVRTDTRLVYRVQVPVNFAKRKITIFNAGQSTGYTLGVREFQRPHPLDFVSVVYGEAARPITRLDGPVLHDGTIRDVVFQFNPNGIDKGDELYGKQFLSFEVRTLNSKGELMEMRSVDNVVICPGDNSPRAVFYSDKQCRTDPLSLNSLLSRKTYDFDDWSRIVVTVKHQASQYAEPGYTQTVELVLKRRYKFDIDVSFPAGLLTRRQGETGYGNFGGISLATLAQLSFYSPDKINRLRPYKIGAGFVALNAFNLSQNSTSERDLGIVILGSVYPTRRDAKFTFPLYLGGGRLLGAGKWFYLLGPGIGVRL